MKRTGMAPTNDPNALRQAVAFYRSGNLAAARAAGEQALRTNATDIGVCRFLGIIYCQVGEAKKGVVLLRRALSLDPSHVGTRVNLARALIELGEFNEAESTCSSDSSAALSCLLGDVRKAQGRNSEAINAYKRAVALDSGFTQAWNNLGNALRDAKDLRGAVTALEAAIRTSPGSSLPRVNLGKTLIEAGEFDQAEQAFRAAIEANGADASAHFELGALLAALGRYAESLEPLRRAAELPGGDIRARTFLGISLAALNQLHDAESVYREATTMRPVVPQAWLYLGLLLEEGNRISELEALLRDADTAGVERGELAVLHARLHLRQDRLEDALHTIKSAATTHSPTATLLAQLTGEVNDRLGRTQVAFEAFYEMKRLRASEPLARRVDRSRYRAGLDQLIAMTTQDWIADWTYARVDTFRPAPTFLVGFPRSGTTLLDTILLGHSHTLVIEEEPLMDRLAARIGAPADLARCDTRRLNELRSQYFEELDKLAPDSRLKYVIDKFPLNLVNASLINRTFPDCRFLFVLRHPCDVVLSCFMQNFVADELGVNFSSISDAAETYDRVMRYWTRCWDLLRLKVHTLRYESLVTNLEGEIRQVLSFLELPWEDGVLDYRKTARERGNIGTPSYAQVTTKIYDRASGRWERYRAQMAPALPVLEPWVKRFGYAEISG